VIRNDAKNKEKFRSSSVLLEKEGVILGAFGMRVVDYLKN